MEKCDSSLCIQYAFDRQAATNKIFFEMMKVIAENFLWGENAGEIHQAFSQKIENRHLGCVSGVYRVLKWEGEEFKRECFDFLVSEYETTLPGGKDAANHFAIHRCIRINLKPVKGPLSKNVF